MKWYLRFGGVLLSALLVLVLVSGQVVRAGEFPSKPITLVLPYLAALVVTICVIGAYSVKNTPFDVGAMVVFGVAGYFMRKGGFPPAPLILAMILGPMLEKAMQLSLISSGGSLAIFIEEPISAALLAVAALLVLSTAFRWLRRRKVLTAKPA